MNLLQKHLDNACRNFIIKTSHTMYGKFFIYANLYLKISLNEFDTLNNFMLNIILKMSCDIYLRIFNKQRNNHGILKKERKIETRSFAKYLDYFGFLPFNN